MARRMRMTLEGGAASYLAAGFFVRHHFDSLRVLNNEAVMSQQKHPPVGVHPDLPLTTGERKAADTDAAARKIIAAERESQEAKAERLRKARLAKEATE
ncbi:hypothetical protein [Nitratireductor sp. GCM10026969]|uniref:hypothetical protein n=1 Tax=Nitratireductor sp. GCM10026969 TaxID=3252645 RepID=UPI0036131F8E